MLVTSGDGCGGTSVRFCLDHRLSRACWSRRRCLFLHFNLRTRLRLEDGTSLRGTDLKKNLRFLVCWVWIWSKDMLCWLAISCSNRVHLAELSLRLSQPELEFDHLPLHLLVVGLQCADKVAHLSVDGTWWKQAGKVNQGKKQRKQ